MAAPDSSIKYDYDYIVIGSGFGGSVSAMRLAQKGYSVAVIESGKRWRSEDYAKTNWNLRKYLWMPWLGLSGIQRMNLLRDFFLVSGAGVGGGSLVYANTLYVPGEKVLNKGAFRRMGGPKALLPFYKVALKMLGVTENPRLFESDHVLKAVADDMGKGHTFRPTPVGVYFGKPGEKHPDPYLGGEGPERIGCTFCGACMVGCRFNSKNTLDKNYLYFAEQLGAQIIPETKVVDMIPLGAGGERDANASGEFGYELKTRTPTGWLGFPRRTLRARSVVLSASVMGTVGLLLKMRDKGRMHRLSPLLGDRVRTNSETVLLASNYKTSTDYSRGVAITSSIHPDDDTHIEPVRYPKGSNFMGALAAPMVDGGDGLPRFLKYFGMMFKHPYKWLMSHGAGKFASNSIILLVMQTVDNSIKLKRARRPAWPFWKTLTSALSTGERTPTYIPVANETARRVAEKIGGIPRSSYNDTLLDAPVTGHIMGGCIVGDNDREGVIDLENRVFGYDNLRVCDGSMLTENLGVNPSLSITALSERAMALIPPKDGSAVKSFQFEKKAGFTKTLFPAAAKRSRVPSTKAASAAPRRKTKAARTSKAKARR